MKLEVKVSSVLCQGQIGTRIKISDHSQTRLDVINLMTVSKLANEFTLKIMFFEISIIVSVCIKFQYFENRRSV